MAAPGLTPCKRYIATHTKDGKSVYADSPDQHYLSKFPNGGGMARSYSIGTLPADLSDDKDVKAYRAEEGVNSYTKPDITVPGGANILVVDFPPEHKSLMHQTVSLDFSICVAGTLEHELDGGEKVTLLPGDHIIQRGTMHSWYNPSKTEGARLIGCTISCLPFDIAGQALKEVFLPDQKQPDTKL